MRFDTENFLVTLNKLVSAAYNQDDLDEGIRDGLDKAYELGRKVCLKDVSKKDFLFLLLGFSSGLEQGLAFKGATNALGYLVKMFKPSIRTAPKSKGVKFALGLMAFSATVELIQEFENNPIGYPFTLERIYQDHITRGALCAATLANYESREFAKLFSEFFREFLEGVYRE